MKPVSVINVDNTLEILHRFFGKTLSGEIFFVQIKENRANKKKWLISIFPKK